MMNRDGAGTQWLGAGLILLGLLALALFAPLFRQRTAGAAAA